MFSELSTILPKKTPTPALKNASPVLDKNILQQSILQYNRDSLKSVDSSQNSFVYFLCNYSGVPRARFLVNLRKLTKNVAPGPPL